MRKWCVYLPGNKRFELESDDPHAALRSMGFTEYGLWEEAKPAVVPEAPSTAPEGPMLLTVPQAARLLGLGRDTTYTLCHRADFPAIRIGRAVRINKAGLQDWLDRNNGGILL